MEFDISPEGRERRHKIYKRIEERFEWLNKRVSKKLLDRVITLYGVIAAGVLGLYIYHWDILTDEFFHGIWGVSFIIFAVIGLLLFTLPPFILPDAFYD